MDCAIVGLGWWGLELAAAARRTGGCVRVVAGCSPVAAEREAFVRDLGTRAFASFEALLAGSAAPGLILATPHSLHTSQVVAAAAAGRHVLVEKPLALSLADAITATDACCRAGVTLAVGHNRRLLSQVGILQRLLADGRLGIPVHVEANFSTPEALALAPDHWRRRPGECPGGGMTVLGIHVLDWLQALFGPAARVAARFERRVPASGLEDAASAMLAFRSGLAATLVSCYAAPYANRFVVHGSEASVSVTATAMETPDRRPAMVLTTRNGRSETLAVPYVDTLRLQLEAWAGACQGKGRPVVDGLEAARNVALLDAIVRAAAEARWVDVDYGPFAFS